jgi:hypothetical protein
VVGFITGSRGEVPGKKQKPVTRNDDDGDNNNNKLGIETAENWYSHIPKPVTEHEDITVLWNQVIQTDREVLANRPDMIIKNKKSKPCLLIDVKYHQIRM